MDPPPAYDGTPLRVGGIRLSPEAQMATMQILMAAFADPGAGRASLDEISPDEQATFRTCRSSGADVYGEISPGGVLDMLWRLGAQPGDRFYDLGAGAGRAACVAWLCGLNAIGVELSVSRWQASQKAVAVLASCARSGANTRDDALSLDFIHGNALDLDFTDADIVLMNSVMFSPQMMTELSATARWMKPGAHIVSFLPVYGGHFKVSVPYLQEIDNIQVSTSWNLSSMFRVFRVACNPSGTWDKPRSLRRLDEPQVGSVCSLRWGMLNFQESSGEALALKELTSSNEGEDMRELPVALPESKETAHLHLALSPEEARVILSSDSKAAFRFDDLGRAPLHCIALRSSSGVISEMFEAFREYAPRSILEEDLQTCLTPYLMVPVKHRVAIGPSGWTAIARSLSPPCERLEAAASADAWMRQSPLELLGNARLSDHLFAGCSCSQRQHDSAGEERLRLVVGPAIVAALRLAHALVGDAASGRPAFADFACLLLKTTRGPNFVAFDPRGPYRAKLSEVVCELCAETSMRLTVAMHALYDNNAGGYTCLRGSELGIKAQHKAHPRVVSSLQPSQQTLHEDDEDESTLQLLETFTTVTLAKCGPVIARGDNFFWRVAGSRRIPRNSTALVLLDTPEQMQRLFDGFSAAQLARDGLELQTCRNGFDYTLWSPQNQDDMLSVWLLVGASGSPRTVEVKLDLRGFDDIRQAGLLSREFAHGAFDHHHLATDRHETATLVLSRTRVLLQEAVVSMMAQALGAENAISFESAYSLGLLGGVSEHILAPAFAEYYKLLQQRHGHRVLEDQPGLRMRIREDVLGAAAA